MKMGIDKISEKSQKQNEVHKKMLTAAEAAAGPLSVAKWQPEGKKKANEEIKVEGRRLRWWGWWTVAVYHVLWIFQSEQEEIDSVSRLREYMRIVPQITTTPATIVILYKRRWYKTAHKTVHL